MHNRSQLHDDFVSALRKLQPEVGLAMRNPPDTIYGGKQDLRQEYQQDTELMCGSICMHPRICASACVHAVVSIHLDFLEVLRPRRGGLGSGAPHWRVLGLTAGAPHWELGDVS